MEGKYVTVKGELAALGDRVGSPLPGLTSRGCFPFLPGQALRHRVIKHCVTGGEGPGPEMLNDILAWVSQEAEPEAKAWLLVVYLGGDSTKQRGGVGRGRQGRRECQ